MPKRIQRKRTKGWRMPEGAVYVGRGSKWGNPFRVGDDGVPDRAAATAEFQKLAEREYAEDPEQARKYLSDIRGKDLACWCPLDQPCHADVLLRLANQS